MEEAERVRLEERIREHPVTVNEFMALYPEYEHIYYETDSSGDEEVVSENEHEDELSEDEDQLGDMIALVKRRWGKQLNIWTLPSLSSHQVL